MTDSGLRVVDLLIEILGSHAETLKLLSALLGEEELIHLLEEKDPPASQFRPDGPQSDLRVSDWTTGETHARAGMSQPYREIEGAVRDMDLPARLEFYLWAYPTYRAWVESAALLDAGVQSSNVERMNRLADLCIEDARQFVRTLTLLPKVSTQAEKLIEPVWIKFRAQLLARVHKPRLRLV